MANEPEVIQQEQPGQAADGSAAIQPVGTEVQAQAPQQDADTVAAAEALRRLQQSEIDKQAAVVAKGIKALREAGYAVTAEQVLQLVSSNLTNKPGAVSVQAAAQPPAGTAPAPQGGQSPAQGGEPPADPVLRKAFDIMEQECGGPIDEKDPEYGLIAQTNDPLDFLESVKAAAQAKAKRTGNLSNPARIPVLAGGTSSHTPNYANTPGVDILEEWNKAHPL